MLADMKSTSNSRNTQQDLRVQLMYKYTSINLGDKGRSERRRTYDTKSCPKHPLGAVPDEYILISEHSVRAFARPVNVTPSTPAYCPLPSLGRHSLPRPQVCGRRVSRRLFLQPIWLITSTQIGTDFFFFFFFFFFF
ncbi:hypothetical protein BD309DRAFT_126927 [Dichomitus squalens]|nr:hypothetical protein BD309DRAFT_126927 [Dichomitus squalens]